MRDQPLAYLITWTTYGTWLPGDSRGWVKKGVAGIQSPDTNRKQAAEQQLKEAPVTLSIEEREIVEATIRVHCEIRGWTLHAVNARSNHIHVVVTADVHPDIGMSQFKAWCSRRLNEHHGTKRERWWTKQGSTKWINDTRYLENAIRYVMEGQDRTKK